MDSHRGADTTTRDDVIYIIDARLIAFTTAATAINTDMGRKRKGMHKRMDVTVEKEAERRRDLYLLVHSMGS